MRPPSVSPHTDSSQAAKAVNAKVKGTPNTYADSKKARAVMAAKPLWLAVAVLALCATAAPACHAQTVLAEASLPDAPQQQPNPAAAPPPDTTVQQPSTTPGASASAPPTAQTEKPATAIKPAAPTSAEVLRREERQRILGVVPNFNTVESAANVPPLTAKQKFHLMYKSSTDPFIFVTAGFVSAIGQARDSNPGFGQGAQGYGKRYGASYADTVDGNLWGNAILPILFKEDPRYFRLGSGTFKRRLLYSARTTVWARRDNGTWGPNYANVIGNFISGGISNLYYPAADGGVETLTGAATVTAEGTIGAAFLEFWPDISHHLFKKSHAWTAP